MRRGDGGGKGVGYVPGLVVLGGRGEGWVLVLKVGFLGGKDETRFD